ncbi:MAG: alpha/beta hydrolase [Burkholderiaceae bacterium]|nr:alpha/beta hydrolase [Burkholderiaceae bacterium]
MLATQGPGTAPATRPRPAGAHPLSDRRVPPPLQAYAGQRPPAPSWFTQALADAPQRFEVRVQGTPVETLAWGRVGDPALLLVHGNGAHADWYSFIAPLLAQGRRVLAFSFSGMGRSGWRTQYAMTQWADEILAVAEAGGAFAAPCAPTVAGHSFGGLVAAVAAARFGQRLARTAIIDAPLRPPSREQWLWHRERAASARDWRSQASEAEALARFRLLPPQDCAHPYLIDHIARHGLKTIHGADGRPRWVWRLDPFLFSHYAYAEPWDALASARCPLVLVRGGRSRLLSPRGLERQAEQAPAGTLLREVADADHHVMLDQPQALAALLAELVPAA